MDERTSVEREAGAETGLRPEHLAAFGVALLAVLVFLPSVTSGFVFDDIPLIVHNEYVQSWRWLPRAFTTHLWDIGRIAESGEGTAEAMQRYYRPLVTTSLIATWSLVGAKPWLYHLTNIVLHGATSGLATRAAIRWTSSPRIGLAVGVLFAIHPTRTENVTWISGRMDVLMLFFVLLALEAFAAFDDRRERGEPRAWLMLAAGFAALTAGVLSKEPAALFPLLLLADGGAKPGRSRAVLIVTSVACGAYLLGRTLFWSPEGEAAVHVFTPAHCLVTIGIYVQRALVPWPPTMYYHALEYDASGPIYPASLLALGAASLALYVTLVAISWRRARTAFWLLLASVAFMGPLLNVYFTGLDVSAQDRFLYAPLFFAVAAVAVFLREKLERVVRERTGGLLLIGVALTSVALIELRTLDYENDQTFWEAELHHHPHHPFVLQMMGRSAASRGELQEAYEYFSRAASPESRKFQLADDFTAHFQRAAVLAALLPDGRVDELDALLAELWRSVEPAWTPPPQKVLDFEVGGPLPADRLQHSSKVSSFHWDVALLATRLGDFERANMALDRLVVGRQAPSPLNGALTLARVSRFEQARVLLQKLGERSEGLAELVPAEEVSGMARRLTRAEELAEARDRASSAERGLFEAVRLAELGAYFAALRALDAGSLLGSDEGAPLAIQLLVACRLEGAARSLARSVLDPERADAQVKELAVSLPPRLRSIPPVEGELRPLLDRVSARRAKSGAAAP